MGAGHHRLRCGSERGSRLTTGRLGTPVETRASGPGSGPDVATWIGSVMPTSTAAPRVRLKVDLLGRLDARTADDRHIRLPGRHAQALFALLVLARRPRSREAIAADLWPDADGTSAGSLRQALWLVRQGLAEAGFAAGEVLDIDTDTVGIRIDACIELDVTAFESASPTTRVAPRRRSSCTTATSSRASATNASRPSASACRTGSRTPSRSSPSAAWPPATRSVRAPRPTACSGATPCAKRRTRC